jgi:hypothetical protein
MKSKEIIKQAKQRFKELEHKQFEWRSFYNGYLEGQVKQLIITGVVKSFVCDIDKGIRCEGGIADYKDGKCKICGQQAN